MAGNIIASLLLGIATKADTSGLNKTDKGLKKLGNTARQVSMQTSMLGKITGGLFGGINIHAIKGAFNEYLQFEKDVGAMKSRFFAITKDEKEAQEEYKYINDLAIQTANNVKSTADSYSIFYSSARRALGKEGARGVFEAWTKVGRVLHLNEQQFERVTYALREMSSKGTLYSQDLKMQLGTHVPDAVNIAETAIKNLGIAGVDTIEGFQKLTKSKPKSGYMAKFLVEFSKEAERRFADPEALKKALLQPDALQQSIMNLGWVFANKFSEAGGRELIVKILTSTYDLLNKIDYEKLSEVLGGMAKAIGLIITHLPEIVSILKDIALSVAIFYGLRGLIKGWSLLKGAFFALKQGKFINWTLLKVFGKEAGMSVVKSISGQLLKGGMKTLFASLLGVGGPLGWVLDILLFLPEILHVIKWIKEKIAPSKELGKIDKNQEFSDTGLSWGKVADIMRQLQSEGPMNQQQLQQSLSKKGASQLYKYLYFTDQGKIEIFIDSIRTDADLDQITKAISDSAKKGKNGKFSDAVGGFFEGLQEKYGGSVHH